MRSPSQFVEDLLQICSDNSLCLADALFLPSSTFTFIRSSHDTVSWLDHILTTTSGYSFFINICVKSDFTTSYHLLLCFTISVDNLNVPISSSVNNILCDALRYNWYGASDLDISKYYSCTRAELSRIKLPLEAMQCEAFGVTSIVVISMFSIVLLLIVCMVVLNNVCLYLNYTIITLLQVGMTMSAIITIYFALILNGG